jgi:hypothetical protein
MQSNDFHTMPVKQVLDASYPVLRYLAQVDQGDYLAPMRIRLYKRNIDNLVLTFDELLRRTPLAKRMSKMLQLLEKNYHSPVDTEFTLHIVDPDSPYPDVEISLLQCRPQSQQAESEVRLPQNLSAEDIVFSTHRMAPRGSVDDIHYVIFVPPESYYALPNQAGRDGLGRSIGLLNAALKDETFICVGPGRWGTTNSDLGLRIGYSDIYRTRALVEVTGGGIGGAPEASFGTHFFQDLVESNIYPLAIYLDDENVIFNRDFFYTTPNHLTDFLPDLRYQEENLRLIDVADYKPGHHLELVMDDEEGHSTAYLRGD